MNLTEPWSKKHKAMVKSASGGLSFSLSNSFAQPLTNPELIQFCKDNNGQSLVDDFMNHSLEYTPNGGSTDLKIEIAKLYDENITADNIMVFTGGQVALQTAAFALAGDCHTIVFTPGYQSTVEAAAHAGGNVTRVQLSPSNGWQINVDDVLAAIKLKETKYLVINEPYNPAGTLMSKALQAELVSVCAEHGIRIMSDEVYRLLEHDPEIRLPSMAEAYELGISCVTMSKPWGACGVTIGWLAFQDLQIKQKLTDAQYFGTACPARSSEIQAMMVLRSSEKILAKNMKIINANVCSLSKFVAKYSEFFSWVKPVAGAIAFIKCEVMTSDELGKELAARGIGIKPTYCFTDEVTVDNEGYFRVGFGEEVKFPIALKALEEFVETVLKK